MCLTNFMRIHFICTWFSWVTFEIRGTFHKCMYSRQQADKNIGLFYSNRFVFTDWHFASSPLSSCMGLYVNKCMLKTVLKSTLNILFLKYTLFILKKKHWILKKIFWTIFMLFFLCHKTWFMILWIKKYNMHRDSFQKRTQENIKP